MAQEPTYFDRMIAAITAHQLLNDICRVEDPTDGGAGTFFATASTVMNRTDFRKLVKAAKARVEDLEEVAHGMPARVMDWRPFIESEQKSLDDQDHLLDAVCKLRITRHSST